MIGFIKIRALRVLIAALLLGVFAVAQDAREALGPKDTTAKKSKGPHAIAELMKTVNSRLKPELMGKHPRVFVTDQEIETLRVRANGTHKDLWQPVLQNIRALNVPPPPPPAETRRAQNEVGIGIVEAAMAYRIEKKPEYLEAARRYMDAAVSYDVWGYAFNKPNVDLAAGHLLYGLASGYDLLYNELTPAERDRYRTKLAKQAKLMAEYYRPKPGRSFSYSQNHVFIPIAGLGIAAYALYDEVPEAPEWAALSRAIYDRVLTTYSQDGYYYEGFEYWVFSTPWMLHYMDAQKHATGENLYDRPGFRDMHYYAAHILLPGGKDMFDFGDVFEGPITRAKQGVDYERSHPGDHLATNYNMLYRLAAEFHDSQIQGVAEWMKSLGQVNAEDFWSLVWYDASVKADPIAKLPTWHYFPDHEVVFWRTDWSAKASALAFKCGPPEGHHTAAQLKSFPDWHLSAGHSHPDANSFIFFTGGQYLTGDSGYAGVPKTEHHNTLVIDGQGQGHEGKGHDPWSDFDYDSLDKVRVVHVSATPGTIEVSGEAAGAYDARLGLQKFTRTLKFDGKTLSVRDEVNASTPHVFTTILHSDTVVKPEGKKFIFGNADPALEVRVVAPSNSKSEVKPNYLTAPGKPGSVDKGEVQQRGERLEISTPAAVNHVEFTTEMKVQPATR